MLIRYKVQQDKGVYCLKGCDDGDLVDYSAFAVLKADFDRLTAELAETQLLTTRDDYAALERICNEMARDMDALRASGRRLREALTALLGIGPKPCGHQFDCICATDAARAALRPAGEGEGATDHAKR